MRRFGMRFLIFLQLIAAIIAVIPSSVHSGEIVIKPGKFDHFNISMPDKIIAGEDVAIKLQAVDAFNNVITNFGETGKEFHATVTGSASINPATFKSTAFVNGTLTLTVSDKVAETINLSVKESGIPIPIMSKDLIITPNKLSSFMIKGPRTAHAGEKFDIKIIAKDSFGNTVLEPIFGKNMNLIFKGNAEPKVDMPSIPDFKNGICSITLVSQKAGTAIVEAKDLITGSSGTSEKIEITSGPVNSFRVFVPKEVIAGEPFEVSVVAVDRFGNVVSNYSSIGSGIAIASSGKLKPFPSSLPAYEFVNGQAKFDLRYDAAEDITITITEIGKAQKGTSESIKVISPIPERYEITTPDSAVAGQKFKIKITVYNQLGNVIRNYNLVGPDVQLSTTGTGTLLPNRIPASEFVNGTAVVEVQYNKSEAFAITAGPVKTPAVKKVAAAPSKQPSKTVTHAKETKKSKKDKEKKAEARTLEITNVSLVEPKKKSTISIHIPNLDSTVKYSAFTETIEGKKWIIVKIKPAVSKIEKTIKFESSFVGNVMVEEDKKDKGAVLVKIEQLKPARFHVAKEKNTLVVTLKH
ncbi:hypothetical protein JZK55_23730 [Dissulfurispira thermophila]|uniref:Uncharacterized protein n=1 Tax=Dissulfurispira thermophila TaxID=2715679 RepID=A0A7G1H5Q0_9BACT|nr:hypothetical protein [Dissulfurispira thermophila]BCB97451.1 hypothetical protein JZK55_23730 [Dissulfurispira thermophila]